MWNFVERTHDAKKNDSKFYWMHPERKKMQNVLNAPAKRFSEHNQDSKEWCEFSRSTSWNPKGCNFFLIAFEKYETLL